MNFLITVISFVAALGPLIIFHELGHYSVARLCGVKVLRFSVGMGKVVWSRRFGADQTEWAISILPLGGYVKMLDDRDPATAATAATSAADQAREFTRQSVWKRIAIVAAGPIANFILATLIFAGLFMHGVEDPVTRIRYMPETTAAWQAGVRGGDKVIAVNGEPVTGWTELRMAVTEAVLDKAELRLDLAQPGGGRIAAIIPGGTMAALSVDSDIMGILGLAIERPPALIGNVVAGGPAARAGLRKGDTIVSVDGKPAVDDLMVRAAIVASAGRPLMLGVQRDSATLSIAVTPELDAGTGQGGKQPRIQAELGGRPEMVVVSAGPVGAMAKGARNTWDSALLQVRMIGRMLTGEISLKNVTGPITIADYAGQTARSGAAVFLSFIAAISISLGVMNLLPIPVLDGGLLLYYSLEVLTGRPLSARVGEMAQRAGVGLLLMLIALAVFNDVARLL